MERMLNVREAAVLEFLQPAGSGGGGGVDNNIKLNCIVVVAPRLEIHSSFSLYHGQHLSLSKTKTIAFLVMFCAEKEWARSIIILCSPPALSDFGV